MMFREAPRIETERLRLRELRAGDLDALHAMWSDPGVVRYIGGQALGREDTWRRALAAAQWAVTGFGYWIAERKLDARLIGQLGFADFKRDMQPSIEGEPELGYVFHPSVHGQGLAFEACSAVLAWGDRQLRPASYPAIISPENAPSIRLAERLGFRRDCDASYKGQTTTLFRRVPIER